MIKAKLFRYRLPLQTPLTFSGLTLNVRRGILIRLERDGKVAWGDCAPLPGFSQDSLGENQAALLRWLGDDRVTLPPAAQCALDLALWQLDQQPAVHVPENVPLLVGSPEQQLAQFDALASTPRLVKLKVARAAVEQEIALVYALLERYPRLRLRLDANRGWDFDTAATFAAAVPLANIDYVEEPCAELSDSLALYRQLGLPLALDETTQSPHYRYQSLPGVKALVLKPTLIGSLEWLRQLVAQANADGVEVVLSSSFESNLGLDTLARLSAELTPFALPGLDTLSALGADLVQANVWGHTKTVILQDELEELEIQTQ